MTLIVKAVFTYEIVVDIDSSNNSYIDTKALAKDLAGQSNLIIKLRAEYIVRMRLFYEKN